MNILVLGSGGREHAICDSLYQSDKVKKVFCAPGNGGIAEVANIADLDVNNFKSIFEYCKNHDISIVIPGSEVFLEKGITDFLKLEGIDVIGPSKYASLLETSKYFTKKICNLSNIKTASWEVFDSAKDTKSFLHNKKFPIVIKMDSLAAGKGVLVCENIKEAKKFLDKIISGSLGNNKSKIIIEECLIGEESSFFFGVDGDHAKFIGSAKDYKRVGDGNKGLNTGGMGCISPAPRENKKVINQILKEIINPTIKQMKELGYPFKGFLYAGVIFTKKGIYLIEYNVRLGDPECQAILARLKTSLLDICIAIRKQKLNKIRITIDKNTSSCIVLASSGYPEKYQKGIKINGLSRLDREDNVKVFHAGTKTDKSGSFFTNGGRVLNIVGKAKNIKDALMISYKTCKKIKWQGCFYRKDIGK